MLAIVLFLLLIIASALVSVAETALCSLSPGQVEGIANKRPPHGQELVEIVRRPRELLVTLLCFGILVNLLMQHVTATAFIPDEHFWLQVVIPFLINFICTDLVPKVLALQHNETLALRLTPGVKVLMRIFYFIVPTAIYLGSWVNRGLFFFLKSPPVLDSRKLLQALGKLAGQEVMTHQERRFVEGLIHLQDATVAELMQPRDEIPAYEIKEGAERLIQLMVYQQHAQLAVYEGDLNQILGILHVHDLLDISFDSSLSPDQLEAFVRLRLHKPRFIPEVMPAVELLTTLSPGIPTLVVDEYGNIAGVVCREDLLEKIFGRIVDRREHQDRYTFTQDGEILASGRWNLVELQELLGIQLKIPYQQQTLGGWLSYVMGGIPSCGSRWVDQGYLFEVVVASATHVRKVLIRPLQPAAS